MAVKLSPLAGAGWQFFTDNGVPLAGGKLFTYAAGGTTLTATYTTSAGNVANSNPIILDSAGRTPAEVWLTEGTVYKLVLKTSTDTTIATWDNIPGINDLSSLSGSGGSASVGFINVGTGAVATTVQARLRQTVSVKDYGATGDGVTDDTSALNNARAYAASAAAAGNVVEIVWPAGRYKYTTSPNWAINRLHMRADGEVWLIGSDGPGFLLDGGATGDGKYGIKIKGDFLIYAIGASSTHGVYMRAISKSDLEFNIRGAESSNSGLYMEWGVSNTMRVLAGVNEGGWYPTFTPARGMTLTQRASSEQSSYNVFVNCELSGCPIGAYLDAALGNAFMSGAMQANTTYNMQMTSNAWANKFFGTDFEASVGDFDIICDGFDNQFIGVDCEDLIKFTAAARDNAVIGGSTEDLVIDAGAARTRIMGLIYNRFTTGTITDNGDLTRFRDIVNKQTGVVSNTPPAKITVNVNASPFTYTNGTGGELSVLISGGTVSLLEFVRAAVGESINYAGTSGIMLTLSPADAVKVTYSAAPAMLVYTR